LGIDLLDDHRAIEARFAQTRSKTAINELLRD